MKIQDILKKRMTKLMGLAYASDGEASVEFGQIDVRGLLKGLGMGVISCLLGSSRGVFSCYPFGIGLLCATDKYVLCSYMGTVVSALLNRGYALPMAVVSTISVMLRFALGQLWRTEKPKAVDKAPKKLAARIVSTLVRLSGDTAVFGESVFIRCAVACFAAFIFGMYRLIAGGFLYYDLFGLIAGFLITPLTTLALSAMYCDDENIARFIHISRAAFLFVTVLALRDYSLFGFTPAFIAAAFICFFISSRAGALRGCTAGLLAGLACGTVETALWSGGLTLAYSLGAAPCILASMGLCCGAMRKQPRGIAVASACIVGVMLGLTVDGYTVLTRIVPDIFAAASLYLPLSHFGMLPKVPVFAAETAQNSGEETFLAATRQADTESRIGALSEAFGYLSETVYALSDKLRRPGIIDLKSACDESFETYCRKCAMASRCHERDCAAVIDAQSKITAILYEKGHIGVDEVPKFLRERCFNIVPITDAINAAVSSLVERLIKTDKTEAFALDYEVMSKLLAEQIAVNGAEYKIDEERTKKLRRTLGYMGFPTSGALCYGNRRCRAVVGGVEMIRMKMSAEEIRCAVENTLGVPMSPPRFGIDDDSVTVTMEAKKQYSCEVAKASSIKENESANGDSAVAFETDDDYFYSIISDGMGSGREAAITSKICTVFAQKMLSAGNGKALTFEMLNGFIRNRGEECSATMDLAEIDLLSGSVCFVKSGAAPSYVVRGGNLYKLQSKTVPIGIMEDIDAEKIRFELKDGDVLIMMSDGVTQSLEEGVWLANLITYEWDDRLGIMAEKILDNAVLANSRSDDMTVILVRISENSEK